MAAAERNAAGSARTVCRNGEMHVDAHKVRERKSPGDHFSQARLFFRSMSKHEQEHIIAAYS